MKLIAHTQTKLSRYPFFLVAFLSVYQCNRPVGYSLQCLIANVKWPLKSCFWAHLGNHINHLESLNNVCVGVFRCLDDIHFKESWKWYIFFLDKFKLKSLYRYGEELVSILREAKKKNSCLHLIYFHLSGKICREKGEKATL